MTLTYPIPAQLNTWGLAYQIEQVLGAEVAVYIAGDELIVGGTDDRTVVDPIVAAHQGEMTPDDQAEADQRAETSRQRDRLDAVAQKAQAVIDGTDTWTAEQAQQLLSRLVLYAIRRR